MPAPDPTALRQFLLGQLPEAEAATVEAFLETHPEAADLLRDLPAEDAFTAALRGRTADPAVPPKAEELARRIAQAGAADRTRTQGEAVADSVPDEAAGQTAADVTAFLAPPQAPDELGRLGDYRILRVLGEGGMGVVFEAEDVRLGRPVAVKVMRPTVAQSPTAKARFLREAKAAAAVEHDHVVPIHLIAEERGVPFLVMPYLRGESLDDRLKRERRLPIPDILRIGRETAEGLAAAHDRGLIHRDIKPGNIWLEAPRDRVKILDFGLARGVNPGGPDANITQSGAVVGTPAYMSPEQGRGQSLDARSDLFSLGGVLYRMSTGRTAFSGADAMSVLMSLAADTPADPRALNPQVPPALAALIMKLLEKDPARRPQSAREVARLLGPTVEPLPAAAPVARPEFDFDSEPTETIPQALPVAAPKSRLGWLAGAAVAVLLVGVGIAFAPTVVRIASNKGELIVEVDDPTIEVVVRGSDAEVRDRTKDRTFVLKAGDGEVEFLDPETGATAVTKKFQITRGGKTVLKATMAEVAAARPKPWLKPKAKAAEWTGDRPPPRDLFPGELLAYETFDPHADGILHLVAPGAEAGQDLRHWFGAPSPDMAFAARVRIAATNRLYVNFGFRESPATTTWWMFEVEPTGAWMLYRVAADTGDGYPNRRSTPVARSDQPDPALASGKWVALSGRAVGPACEVRMNGRLLAQDTEGGTVGGASGELQAVEIGAHTIAAGLLRLDLDHVAVWKLPPAAPTASPQPWAGLLPPPRDGFPGELIAYQTFDDAKALPLDLVPPGQAADNVVKDGVYFQVYPADRPEVSQLLGQFGGPARDVAVVARLRAANLGWYAAFRSAESKDLLTHVVLHVDESGKWKLVRERTRVLQPKTEDDPKFRDEPAEVLAKSDADHPDLAAGRWITLTVHTLGGRTQVWANGKPLADVAEPNPADRALPAGDEERAVTFGIRPPTAGSGRLELDHVAVWKLAAPTASPDRYRNTLGMEFARVPKGKAWLGGGAGRLGDREVEFREDFYLGVSEVTQEQWEKVMGKNPSAFARQGSLKDAVKDQPDADLKRFPVESVSWEDAQRFVQKLNELAPEPGWTYRLPWSDEWEYACRGGPMADRAESAFEFTVDRPTNELHPDQANFRNRLKRPGPVGSYPANRLGLHDMHGNVWEWGADGPNPDRRWLLGGCYAIDAGFCRLANRGHNDKAIRYEHHGLRVARVPVDRERYTNPVGMEFARVPKGTSWLGGSGGKPGNRAVEFKEDFFLGVYEVTQEEWAKVMGNNPSHLSRTGAGKEVVRDISDADLNRFPVEMVSYQDIQAFLAKLNEGDRQPGWVYRLPTEAEWEYACRGGPMSDRARSGFDGYFFHSTNELTPFLANMKHAAGLNRPCRVGLYPPNPLGLHDMIGNLWEICDDAITDEKDGPSRRLRGGFYGDTQEYCRAAGLGWVMPRVRKPDIGFRVARVRVPDAAPSPYALAFDGQSTYVDLPFGYDGSHPITIEAAVTVDPAGLDITGLVTNLAMPSRGKGGASLHLGAKGQGWQFIRHRGGKEVRAAGGNAIQPGRRTHLAGVWDGRVCRLFVDGTLVALSDATHEMNSIDAAIHFVIGCERLDGRTGWHYRGLIDEVRISRVARYERDYTPARRLDVDAQTLALYRFDEGQGEVLKDASGNNHHGKIIGARWVKVGAPSGPAPLTPGQRQAIEWVRARGGYLTLRRSGVPDQNLGPKSPLPDHPFQVIGISRIPMEQVTEAELLEQLRALPPGLLLLELNYAPLTDAGAETLAGLPSLASLTDWMSSGTKMTDDGLRHLAKLPRLTALGVGYHRGITAKGIAHLRGLPLRVLGIQGCPVDDSALAVIAGMRDLTHLNLADTQVTATGMAALKVLPKLEELFLGGSTATPAALGTAASFPNVGFLSLSSPPVDGLPRLAQAPRLDVLWLSWKNGALPPGAIEALSQCKQVKQMIITETRVAPTEAEKLAAALPGCKVEWDGGVIQPKAAPKK